MPNPRVQATAEGVSDPAASRPDWCQIANDYEHALRHVMHLARVVETALVMDARRVDKLDGPFVIGESTYQQACAALVGMDAISKAALEGQQ